MEINNNINSSYLHGSEDKSDNFVENEKVKKVHRVISSMDARSSSIVCEDSDICQKSSVDNNCKDIIMDTIVDEKAHNENELITQLLDLKQSVINNEKVITSDSKKIEIKNAENTVENTLLMTQLSGESTFIFIVSRFLILYIFAQNTWI